MRLIFTRHGESEANVLRILSNRGLPHGLTEKGREQAMQLAQRLAGENVMALYASHILRAQQTAQIVSERIGLPIITSTVLRDFDCGEMEGRGDAAAWAAHHAVIAAWRERKDYDARIPGGESYNDIRARFVPFVDEVIREYGDRAGTVAVVMHGSVLGLFAPVVMPNIGEAFAREQSVPNCACIVAELRGGRLHCSEWNGLML
jgi:broad specificity phosphatase PhoE